MEEWPERREQLVEELRIAERARDLLAGLEQRLDDNDRSDLQEHLGRLDQLEESLPEGRIVRLLVEDATKQARTRGRGKAGSVASRCRSKSEGRISRLRGIIEREDALASKEE
jgi:hypothetical protein